MWLKPCVFFICVATKFFLLSLKQVILAACWISAAFNPGVQRNVLESLCKISGDIPWLIQFYVELSKEPVCGVVKKKVMFFVVSHVCCRNSFRHTVTTILVFWLQYLVWFIAPLGHIHLGFACLGFLTTIMEIVFHCLLQETISQSISYSNMFWWSPIVLLPRSTLLSLTTSLVISQGYLNAVICYERGLQTWLRNSKGLEVHKS